MQTLPTNWAAARSGPYRWETKVTIAGTEYGEADIISLQTSGALYTKNSVSVGGCVSREIDLTVISKSDIPRMAEIRVWVRPVSNVVGDWIPKGVYFIDTRQTDFVSGTLIIHGYDAMLKMEQMYLADDEDVTGWPKSMPTVMAEIAAVIGVELDERNVLQDYLVEAPAGYTMREVAGWIAAAHAGNWTITDAGKLRLVPLYNTALDIGYLADEDGNAITFGGVMILV